MRRSGPVPGPLAKEGGAVPWSAVELYALLPAFALVMCRVVGLTLAAPLFSSAVIPTQVKAFIAVAMGLAVYPFAAQSITVPVTLSSALLGLIGELMVGLVMGFGATLLFVGVQYAAELIGQQAGLGLGAVFNPMLDTSTTELSQLYFFVAMLVFLAAGGDHALVQALLDSFQTVPLLGYEVTEGMVALMIDMMQTAMVVAIRVAGPTMLALLLSFLALGFVSRTVPQLNILSVGFPIKLAMALFIMAMTLISLEPVLLDGMDVCLDGLREALG